MDISRQQKAIAALEAKGAKLPCSRCGHSKFALVGESVFMMQEKPEEFVVGGPVIPVVLVVCENCGNISTHAAKVLDIMPTLPNGGT